MSLRINGDKIRRVMIGGIWFDVKPKTFDVDSYEYVNEWTNHGEEKTMLLHNGGAGFTFQERGGGQKKWVSGPIAAIQAVEEFHGVG